MPARIQYKIIFLSIAFSLLTICGSLVAQDINTDFLQMTGKRTVHPFTDPYDSLSAPEIIELRNEKGIPVWFGRKVRKVVCLTGECQIANLWLFWNGVGNFLGFQRYNNEPLTKTDHKEFTPDDYRQLHLILSDSESILRQTQQDELIAKPAPHREIDGTSGATHLSFKDYLVEDAAYTCYTLWHTVYGNTAEEINSILEKRINRAYLQLLLHHEDNSYKIWAINQIAHSPVYQKEFNVTIMSFLRSDANLLSQSALSYFSGDVLSDFDTQLNLISRFGMLSYRQRLQIIQSLSQQKRTNDKAIIRLLQYFEDHEINAFSLNYVYHSIHAENMRNAVIKKKITRFTKHSNSYVREISLKLLTKFN